MTISPKLDDIFLVEYNENNETKPSYLMIGKVTSFSDKTPIVYYTYVSDEKLCWNHKEKEPYGAYYLLIEDNDTCFKVLVYGKEEITKSYPEYLI